MASQLVKRGKSANGGKAQNAPDETSGPTLSLIQGWKKWLLRACLAILTPCIFLLVLELGLRVVGYGYPSSCFLRKRADGRAFFIENSKFELRFFPPALVRIPSSYTIPAGKNPGTYRIFVVGSSAAAGFPEPAYGFSRILEVILKAKYPERHFEIINTATTAINSNVDLSIVEEAAGHQPDLFIFYDGHNEVLGPFGPGTIFVPYSDSLAVIRSTIFIKSTRIGQLLDNLRLRLMSEKFPAQWRGMEMVAKNQLRRDDPRLLRVNSHFRSNLIDICRTANRTGAKVILATLGTNLRDAAPFASLHRAGLSSEQLSQWKRLYQQGVDAESGGKYSAAIHSYQEATAIDDQFADLQFRLARSYESLQDYSSANDHYLQARDDDALRFRADSKINAIIRGVAAAEHANGVSLVDMEKLVRESASPRAAGVELFYDHVHLNFAGNYLLANKISEEIDLQLSGSTKVAPSQEESARQLAFTDWSQAAVAKDLLPLIQEAPFTDQLTHEDDMARLNRRMKDLIAKGTQKVVTSSRRVFEQAIQSAPDDWMLHNQYGILLLDSGDSLDAADQFRKVMELLPYRAWPHVALAQALAKTDKNKAQKEYEAALSFDPDLRSAHLRLADLLLEEGYADEALTHYRAVMRQNPQDAAALVGEGNAWSQQGKNSQATDAYERALQDNPSSAEAHYRLGDLLMRQGATADAIAHLQQAVQLNFAYADAHVSLGRAYEGKSQWEAALEQYLTAATVDPGQLQRYYGLVADVLKRTGRHGAAELALGDACSAQHKWSEAAAHYAEAVKVNPRVAEFHLHFATALHNLGRESQARAELAAAMQLDPRVAERDKQRPGGLN